MALDSFLSQGLRVLWTLALVGASSFTHAITVRVGLVSDPACTSFSIPGAIAQLPAGTTMHRILLSSNQAYQTAGIIDSRNVSIEGGYANCSAATPTAGATTRIGPFPAATGRLLTAQASGSTVFTVTLRDIELVGPAPAGGVLARGSVDLVLVDSRVEETGTPALEAGGGVRSEFGASIFLRGTSQIIGNRADIGGGIFCNDSGRVFIQSSDVLIAGNVATFGGGLGLATGCRLVWDPDTPSTQGGINGNRALLGGGIFVNDADIESSPSAALPYGPRRVIANLAEYDGGGISLNQSSVIFLPSLDVVSNTAGLVGGPASQGNCGGITVDNSVVELAAYRIDGNVALRDGGGMCLRRGSFSRFGARGCSDGACRSSSNNRAGRFGGAYWLGDGSELSLAQARVVGNTAMFDSAIHAEDTDTMTPRTTVTIQNSLFTGNTATSGQLFAFLRSGLSMLSSTIADNASGASTLIDLGGSTLDLKASILVDPADRVLDAPLGTTLATRCLITQENQSLQANGGDAMVTPPGFVNAGAGDYRLLAQANAVDVCAPVGGDLPFIDISGNPRPVDLPLSNIDGPWDVGAYETQIFDRIFADGFGPNEL